MREERAFKCFSLRSSKFRRSEFIEPRVKVHLLDEGCAWVPKRRDFTEDPNKEISGNQIFQGLEGVLETSFGSTTLQEIGIFLLWFIFFYKGYLIVFFP